MTPRSLSWSSVLWLIGRLSACALAAVLGLLAMPSVNQAADDKPAAKAKEEKQAWIPDRREFVAHIVRIDAERRILGFNAEVRHAIVYHTRAGSGRRSGGQNIPLGDIAAADDLKVRLPYPPPATDERGNPKKYTTKELKALKGPGNEWGYTADFDSLKQGQTVRFYLKWPKPAAKPPARKPNATKEAESAEAAKPVIATIHIVAQPPQQ